MSSASTPHHTLSILYHNSTTPNFWHRPPHSLTHWQVADQDTDTWGATSGDVPMKPIVSCPNPQSSRQVIAPMDTLLSCAPPPPHSPPSPSF